MRCSAVSRPARGAWIEIDRCENTDRRGHSRAPQGVRGLKFESDTPVAFDVESRPARGAWIEISVQKNMTILQMVAPRKGCVD